MSGAPVGSPTLEVVTERVPFQGAAGLHELVGREFALERWHTITDDAVKGYCAGTGEPIGSGNTVVPGFMTLGLVVGQFFDTFEPRGFSSMVSYGVNRMRLPHPLFVGDGVRARFKFVAMRDLPLAIDATLEVTIEREQGEKPACWVEWVARGFLQRTRPSPGCDT